MVGGVRKRNADTAKAVPGVGRHSGRWCEVGVGTCWCFVLMLV